ncbi:MAG TPA: Holliday junction branch migration protein RuvA [bacterium]|jgi:Holliday junction DNA helicase RuvA|nr:Holliday junction branch migration protein RuvA [bacterium]HNZ51694.1 Holliday junction branch migration protein RuvA [bacterium]HOF79485.1 Holliday junction branch migration protein RuvA [bacterium]HOQ91964.1 Holliday junction branch migration protein RuvA [bacterium]HPL22520.1 Holliday junction branch migration protein RuvA [bacterium]
MLAFLRGQVLTKRPGSLIIDNNGLGYQVFVGERFWEAVASGQSIEVYLYHSVREDAADLYGFASLDELSLFELLVSVSGIGPKSALGILSLANVEQIKQAIILGDESLLTKVSGIGAKTAQRLILELSGKIAGLLPTTSLDGGQAAVSSDDLEALIALGYSASDARRALSKVDAGISDPAQRLKSALQYLH